MSGLSICMAYSKQRIKEIADVKQTAVRRIRTAIDDINLSRTHKYIEDFNAEFATFQDVCEPDEILRNAANAHLVWIGDYHVLSRFQEFVSDFVRKLFRLNRNIALGVEPVFARHQKILDRWMKGRISEQAFLEAIRYDEEWGCDWKSYAVLFSTARELGIPIYGVDCHPRYDMRSIGRRDAALRGGFQASSKAILHALWLSCLASLISRLTIFRAAFGCFWKNARLRQRKC